MRKPIAVPVSWKKEVLKLRMYKPTASGASKSRLQTTHLANNRGDLGHWRWRFGRSPPACITNQPRGSLRDIFTEEKMRLQALEMLITGLRLLSLFRRLLGGYLLRHICHAMPDVSKRRHVQRSQWSSGPGRGPQPVPQPLGIRVEVNPVPHEDRELLRELPGSKLRCFGRALRRPGAGGSAAQGVSRLLWTDFCENISHRECLLWCDGCSRRLADLWCVPRCLRRKSVTGA